MQIPEDVVGDLTVTAVEKIHARRPPTNRRGRAPGKENVVKVTFKTTHERDLVISYAPLLRDDSNVDVVVPDHLLPLKRHLESLAYKMRRNAREDNTKISTSIRLQDKA